MKTSFTAIESYDILDYPVLSELYDADEQLHVYVWATATTERSDYGVPGSPVWDEIVDIEVEEFEINGVVYTWKELNSAFSAAVADELHVIAAEKAEEQEDWE